MDPGTALAVTTISGKFLSIIWKYYMDVDGAQSEIKLLANELEYSHNLMQEFQQLAGKSSKLPLTASLDATIEQALSDLKTLESRLDPKTGAKAMRRLGKRALKWPFTKGEVEQWITRFQRLKETANLALNADQTSLIIDVDANVARLKQSQEAAEQDRLLAKLPLAGDASFDSYHRQHEPLCIENTRVGLLQQYRDWGASHPRPLYWLSGMAGTGKSTIARTLAHYFHSIGTLGGSFFFSRSSGEASNAVNFVGTLARHLANTSPELRRFVCEAILSHEDVTRQGLRNQWRELIMAPLSTPQPTGRTTLNFVIDALDECGSDDEIRLILQLCVEVKCLQEVDLGVFVTSRPEIAIRLGFEAMPDIIYQKLDLGDVPRPIVEHDLSVLLEYELGRVSAQHKLSDWPKGEDIRSLLRQSDCLFIYATTACRYIGDSDWDPEERLSEVLSAGSLHGGTTAGLDSIYIQVLTSSLISGRNEAEVTKVCDRFKQVVGSIVTLFDELSACGLAGLLSTSEKSIRLSLARLHSVLNIPPDNKSSIRLLHPSFRDFLLHESRCTNKHLYVNGDFKHEELARLCLGVLSTGLRRNMGHLTTPGSPPQDVDREHLNTELPQHVRYACQYWVDHIEDSKLYPDNSAIDEKICSFFQKDFLHWLEAMSLIAKMSQAVLMITRLVKLVRFFSNNNVRALVEDARRFILSNRSIIERALLQIYASALVFSPKQSFVRKSYSGQLPTWPIRNPTVEDRWGSCVQNLEATSRISHKAMISFSYDGKYIAAILTSGDIEVWSTATGALHSTIQQYDRKYVAIKFLSNRILASMDSDGTVRWFDQVSCVLCRMVEPPTHNSCLPTESEELEITPHKQNAQLSILPNDDLVILLPNRQLCTWSCKNEIWSRSNIPGMIIDHLYGCLSDGRLVALLRHVDIVERRNPWGPQLSLLDLRTNAISTVKIVPSTGDLPLAVSSLDVIACGTDYDGTIELYNADTAFLGKLGGQSSFRVSALTFSPNGRYLVSVCLDRVLRWWNLQTHAGCSIDIFPYQPSYVAFSPDSKNLATTWFFATTIRLYELSSNTVADSGEVVPKNFTSIELSPGGQQLAGVSLAGDNGIYIYSTETGLLEHTLPFHSSYVTAIAFSPDGEQLATATLRLWNPKQLAAASSEETLRLWNPKQGTSAIVVNGIPGFNNICRLVFSSDGKYLASGNREGKTLILDAESGALNHVFELGSSVGAISFSSDDEKIVCATNTVGVSNFNGIREIGVWMVSTGQLLYEVESSKFCLGPDSYLHLHVAMSPNGRYLSYSYLSSLVIHDMQQKRDLSTTVKRGLRSMAFSAHSESLATRDMREDLQLWDVGNLRLIRVSPNTARPNRISIPTDGSFLESELGQIPMRRVQVDWPNDLSTPLSRWRYNELDGWVMEGARKMLWVPPAYRPSDFSQVRHRAGLFVFATVSGLRIMKFNQGEVVTEMEE